MRITGFTVQGIKKIILLLYDNDKLQWSGPIAVEPNDERLIRLFGNTCAISNYAFGGFEGEKARRSQTNENIVLMPTLEWNWQRFNRIIKFFETEYLPWEFYKESHIMLIKEHKDVIPSFKEEYYIRPVFAVGQQLGMKIHSDTPRAIAIFGTRVERYYADQLKIYALTDQIRCLPGGTGWMKASGNYPNSMLGQRKARQKGYDDSLFLDETLIDPTKAGGNWEIYENNIYKNRLEDILECNIQELAVANVCAIKNGVIYSPLERDTILPSITKGHIFQITKEILKIGVVDNKPIKLKGLLEADEVFACGTAAGITPIIGIGVLDQYFKINNEQIGETTQEIKKHLAEIYWGYKDPFNWMFGVKI